MYEPTFTPLTDEPPVDDSELVSAQGSWAVGRDKRTEEVPYKFSEFKVYQGDMFEVVDWSDADLVLANSTCFDNDLMIKIAAKCSHLKKGSWAFTLTKRLPTSEPDFFSNPALQQWECVLSIKRDMSWGLATVHIHRKII